MHTLKHAHTHTHTHKHTHTLELLEDGNVISKHEVRLLHQRCLVIFRKRLRVHCTCRGQLSDPCSLFPMDIFPEKSLSLSLSLSLPLSLPPSLVLALSPAVCPVCVHTRVHKVGENTSLVPLFDESFVVWDLLEPDSTDQTKLDPRK